MIAVIVLAFAYAMRGTATLIGCSADDSSASHYDGALVGNPAPECVAGVSGNALRFASGGAQNYVSIPYNASFYPTGAFTIATTSAVQSFRISA